MRKLTKKLLKDYLLYSEGLDCSWCRIKKLKLNNVKINSENIMYIWKNLYWNLSARFYQDLCPNKPTLVYKKNKR